jgi:hypothetical protein
MSVRLACLIHAASVHPELGSNSNLRSTFNLPFNLRFKTNLLRKFERNKKENDM